MDRFVSFGYYNGLDAVMMNHCSADEIVSNMERGIGDFRAYEGTDVCDESGEYLLVNHYAKKTEDGEYVVVYDVADKFEDVPLDLVADNAQDEFIEVWKKMG